MPVYLAITAFGVFILNESCEIVGKVLTYPDVELSVSNMLKIRNGETSDVLKTIVGMLDKLASDAVVVEDSKIAKALPMVKGLEVNSSNVHKQFRDSQIAFLVEEKIVSSADEAETFRRGIALQLAKATVSSASEEKDLLITSGTQKDIYDKIIFLYNNPEKRMELSNKEAIIRKMENNFTWKNYSNRILSHIQQIL